MAAGAAYVEELVGRPADAIGAACRRWAREQARWPTLSELLTMVEEVERAEKARISSATVEAAPTAWERIANAALGALPNCFLRRVEQLEPDDRQRIGRELADFASQWELRKIADNGRQIERWASEWLGVTWAQLMGPPPEPTRRAGPMRPAMPDTSGLQRVVVEREAEVA